MDTRGRIKRDNKGSRDHPWVNLLSHLRRVVVSSWVILTFDKQENKPQRHDGTTKKIAGLV